MGNKQKNIVLEANKLGFSKSLMSATIKLKKLGFNTDKTVKIMEIFAETLEIMLEEQEEAKQ